jgi:hypothetical protein
VPPINPGDTPNLTNLFGNAMEQAKIEWAHNRQVIYEMHKNVNTALISVFRKAIDANIIVDMETDPAIHGVEELLTYFHQFMRAYGHTDPLAIEKITKAMEEPWNPTTDDISKLIRQMRDAMRYMTYINQPISENELLNKAELLILKSQQMKNEYSLWKSLAHHDRTCHNFIVWCKEKYHIWKTAHTSASMLGYGGGIQSMDGNEIDINNAATNAANAATFQQLTQSNNALAQQLQALTMQNSQLQQQIANVQQAPAFQQPPIMYQPPPPQMPQQQFVPQQQFIAPQVQQQQYWQQQYGQQQYAPQDYSSRGRGAGGRGYGHVYGPNSGRGVGRGYGRGGDRRFSCGNSGYQNQQQQYNTAIKEPPTIKMPTIQILAPKMFTNDALYHMVGNHIESYSGAYVPDDLKNSIGHLNVQVPLEEVAGAGVVHPVTGETLTKYEQLLKVPALCKIWSAAMCKELGRLANGWEGEQGTETIEFMSIDKIKVIPRDRTVTYARIVVDYRPQKKDPNRVCITVGDNLIDYPGELTTRTADLI